MSRDSFGSRFGALVAMAGSAVGLGNLWRFPYLVGENGGAAFIVVYIILCFLICLPIFICEFVVGRRAQENAYSAYRDLSGGSWWKYVGIMTVIVPLIVTSYYSVIGGWVLKYLFAFLTGSGSATIADGYFTGFITAQWEPLIWFVIYMFATALVVYKGVESGIEKFSKVLMPLLLVLILGIAIFSLFLRHTDDSGITRTGLQGLKVYVVPNFEGMTLKQFLVVLTDAMGQLFYSISVAMGIMITYGSYLSKGENLQKNSIIIPLADTLIAVMAGMAVMPACAAFGVDYGRGPGLLFVSMQTVFENMGSFGNFVGFLFYFLVFIAAVTSSISLLEVCTTYQIDKNISDGTFDNLSKREKLQISRQRAKLEKNLGSISDLNRLPAALFVIDVQKEQNAVREAKRLNIPVFAMVDTCCDPTDIDYVIPANDDAAKSIALILDVVCGAIAEGLEERKLEREKAETEAEANTEAPARTGKTRVKRGVKAAVDAQENAAAEIVAATEQTEA